MTVDVAARLAQGQASVANTQAYVSACHAIGYRHPDLTAHGAQVVEWYCSEEGLELRALDADCTALRGAAAAADEAVRLARDGLATVSAAWAGQSGSVAADFLDRHCASAAEVARAVHAAAVACEVLRDGLGRLVDEKVGAAVAIDDRRAGERPAWLAAAATVTSGGAGRDEAIETVTHQITPYVDADIRTEWVAAMRSATAAVEAAYEEAVRQLNAAPAAHFDVPGPFGGPAVLSPDPVPAAARTVPAAASVEPAPLVSSPVAEPPPAPAPSQPTSETPVTQPLPSQPASEAPAGMPSMPTMPAMPDATGGLSGLVGQIADALGGLFEGLPDAPASDDVPELDDPVEQGEDTSDDEVVEPVAEEAVPEEVPVAEEAVVDEPEPVEEPPAADAEPAPPPPPEAPESLAAEQPAPPGEQTPCEIAADELAQVGQ
ncbi:hypothetical protein EV580_1894 [Mycobacterium sp. BK086]|uniref:hypothetical protein n=1 Tax=Mycobacterium sp. BK086 TaxID=2512165 RepID=UPI00105CCFAB|nr:hypothetical protein [Mycobacterium sp. BK086]TDO18706.1 hypothetical protein EV580_1894 [Mycobacterium sp. BK086]